MLQVLAVKENIFRLTYQYYVSCGECLSKRNFRLVPRVRCLAKVMSLLCILTNEYYTTLDVSKSNIPTYLIKTAI